MMKGNHRTSCTFTAQEIGRWVVTHSKADSNLHGHCLAISGKQCPLWILFMSQHLNPSSALSDHRKSVAWLISNGPHILAYCYKLGPNLVKAECLCPRKAATIFQDTHATPSPSRCWETVAHYGGRFQREGGMSWDGEAPDVMKAVWQAGLEQVNPPPAPSNR